MPVFHPHHDDDGKPVRIHRPSRPSALATWTDPSALATTVPLHPIVASLHGVPFAPWTDAPLTDEGWHAVAGRDPALHALPKLVVPKGKQHAAGIVVEEPDGRVWVVSPTNQFGTYVNTFAKGKADGGAADDLQAVAIRECFEESGLRVEITGFLADSPRSTSITRFFLGRRVGGHPSHMGWESQAVHLVPRAQLAAFVNRPEDKALVALLDARP